MRYELYLRSLVENKGWPGEDLLDALKAAGFDLERGLPARTPNSKLQVEAYPADRGEEAEEWLGLNFSFPLGSDDADGGRAIDSVFAICEDLSGQIFDPQLGRMVGRKDHEAVAASWRRSYAFHSGVAGSIGLGGGGPRLEDSDDRDGWLTRYKPILLAALVIFVGSLMFRSCFTSWFNQALVAPAPVAQTEAEP